MVLPQDIVGCSAIGVGVGEIRIELEGCCDDWGKGLRLAPCPDLWLLRPLAGSIWRVGLMGENAHYGTPVNVNAPGRVPGGSSSGSAAAVAGALVDFAIGTDCGGSVRLPASLCGIYGFRPSHGRIGLDGCMPLASSFATFGWFAREAATLARVGAALLPVGPLELG